ncbi:mitogen-activated protein kinase kinase kinase 4 isoform X1 [Pieris napi]|uniref:mitogen-activated protein kinase kinase kinase 4 isoform X1 n=1 Tax=Pieris napi TaxID=78633 RepID=UPI001FB9EDB5|nr:mitogen-activated protein kinase kinase kinase 4 isoform X1 [Pieris napi]
MVSSGDKEWKSKLEFPINYDSGQSSDDENSKDVVMRHHRSSHFLLEECGDGSEADLLGSTPPRSRIRDKEKRRNMIDSSLCYHNMTDGKSVDSFPATQPTPPERLKKRASMKFIRAKERDWKQDFGQMETKADSLPSPSVMAAVPTLKVESCSRFMSLVSRPKCRQPEEEIRCCDDEVPASRINFHDTFSMLINMGNMEKGCRRTISREEQVWQNELKDLIWLELQAKLSGRTLEQQDDFLCTQRNVIPNIVQRILDYKFVSSKPVCRSGTRLQPTQESSNEDLSLDCCNDEVNHDDIQIQLGCLSIDCTLCSDVIGEAMREVGGILDAFDNAVALYPSSTAAKHDHPALASPELNDRIRAMCLWYNTALHMRLKLLSVRRLLRIVRARNRRREMQHKPSVDSTSSRSSDAHSSQVRFNVTTPSGSNSSASSGQSHDDKKSGSEDQEKAQKPLDNESLKQEDGTTDSGYSRSDRTGDATPEIVLDTYSTNDSEDYASVEQECLRGDAFYIGPLDDLTQMRLLDRQQVSVYRDYHYDMLKTAGVRRCMMFMNKIWSSILHKVYHVLQEPQQIDASMEDEAEIDSTKDDKETNAKNIYVLKRYGCWSPESISMQLPSFRNHFLLLNCICMEALHDYLALRVDSRPDQPSCLTIKQLIHELKEGLDIAAETRASFARNVEAALRGWSIAPTTRQDLLMVLKTYDATVDTCTQLYLSYLRTMSLQESMSRAALSAEWGFAIRLAARAPPARKLAPPAFADIACNQLDRILKQYQEKFDKLKELELNESAEGDAQRYVVYLICREAQTIYMGSRESALQAAQWARALANRLPPHHARYKAQIFNSLMALRNCLVEQTKHILERSRLPASDPSISTESWESLNARVRELLLQIYKLGFELHMEMHKFAQAPFKLQREMRARRLRPSSLQPSRVKDPVLRRKRPETVLIHESFNPMLHKELHRFVSDAPSCRPIGRPAAPTRRVRLMRSESIGEEGEGSVLEDICLKDNIVQGNIETLLSGSETPKKTDRMERCEEPTAEEADWAKQIARAVIEFARCWMLFVVERCDRGRGLRPRWASQGLEFLMLACDPYNTKHLTEEEFEDLKQLMDGCISHVIGSRPTTFPSLSPTPPHRHRLRLHSPIPNSSHNNKEAQSPPSEQDTSPPVFATPETPAFSKRVRNAVQHLDEARDEKLREDKRVGRVLGAAVQCYEPKLRQLKFKWQRGLKIGAGTFGKVYTVVNTESGQVLAMKELSIGAGDRRALQRAANELRVLEGVVHPHLVRYYGCELHREEMLLFMELCVEGSLEALIATSGALAEHTTRRYTKQLLCAVNELHARSIAHRDIKSGNIFLTNEGHCLKLGDFGCAVKIRANTTAPGELQGFVGTQAYMAPEVFMKSSGHGRAADMWSLGCVVTEMASGKRPFSEYDSNYQIMFVVGMGGRPHIPDSLSKEGQDFCMTCLTHDPENRPRAEELKLHHFLMVKSDDDCTCESARLMR